MPELPEVETIKNVLNTIVKGNKILKIDVLYSGTIIGDAKTFSSSLEGETFNEVTRIGKHLIFHLTNNKVFLSHLRMEGKYYEVLENERNTTYSKVVFHLSNGHKLCYDDSRCFGKMKLTSEDNFKSEEEIAKLGPEPFDVKDVNFILEKVKKSGIAVKTTLLDQTLMTGIGNIYADEILYSVGIHPLTPAKFITKKQWEEIVKNAKRILAEAIELGGSTIRSYHPGKNIDGSFQVNLKAYGMKDKECPKCGSIMRFMKVNGRGTTYCPTCQAKSFAPIKVAIYGKIASGKSTILSIFKDEGFPVISADEIVHEVYQDAEVANHIKKMFRLPLDKPLDLNELRMLCTDSRNRRTLEAYIHPIVRNRVEKFLTSKSKLVVDEIPLLYESQMEDMFDYIIAVDIDPEIQLERLKIRNGDKAEALLLINEKNSKFDRNKIKADTILKNNTDQGGLEKSTKEIINKLLNRLN